MKADRFEKAKVAERECATECDQAKSTRDSALSSLQVTLERSIHYQFGSNNTFKYNDVGSHTKYIMDAIAEWREGVAKATGECAERIKVAREKFAATLASL